MVLALAYLMMVAVETPDVARHCGDICRLAQQRPVDMAEISGKPPEHPEKAFADYAVCLASALERSTISSQSSKEDIDRALQSVDDNCAAARTAGTAAFIKLVVASGSHNKPAEIASFADFVREMIGAAKLLPVIAQKIGQTKSTEYLDMVKPSIGSLMARK